MCFSAGLLDKVTNLTSLINFNGVQEQVIYTWLPPFSLNVTSADPDIAYCVRIYNVTCPMEMTSPNEVHTCSVYQPNYMLPKNIDATDIYEIEVTPRTNIEDWLNGTNSETYRGTCNVFTNNRCTIINIHNNFRCFYNL